MNKFRLNFEALFRSSKLFRDFKNKRLLKTLRKQIFNYSKTFSMTFYNHLKSEFEVNVRGGQITPQGFVTFARLQKDSTILQYKQNIEAIFLKFNRPEFASSNKVIKDQILISFLNIIKQVEAEQCQAQEKLGLVNCGCLPFTLKLRSSSSYLEFKVFFHLP